MHVKRLTGRKARGLKTEEIGCKWQNFFFFFLRRQWQPILVLLPGKSHGRRSLVGCSPWGRWVQHDWATSLSLFTFMHWRKKWQLTPVFLPGNPREGGAWWAAIYGVAKGQTQLKWLGRSSSQTIFLSLLSDRRKQTSDVFFPVSTQI